MLPIFSSFTSLTRWKGARIGAEPRWEMTVTWIRAAVVKWGTETETRGHAGGWGHSWDGELERATRWAVEVGDQVLWCGQVESEVCVTRKWRSYRETCKDRLELRVERKERAKFWVLENSNFERPRREGGAHPTAQKKKTGKGWPRNMVSQKPRADISSWRAINRAECCWQPEKGNTELMTCSTAQRLLTSLGATCWGRCHCGGEVWTGDGRGGARLRAHRWFEKVWLGRGVEIWSCGWRVWDAGFPTFRMGASVPRHTDGKVQ